MRSALLTNTKNIAYVNGQCNKLTFHCPVRVFAFVLAVTGFVVV